MVSLKLSVLSLLIILSILQFSQETISNEDFSIDLVRQHLLRIIGKHKIRSEAQLESVIYFAFSILARSNNDKYNCQQYEQFSTNTIVKSVTGILDLLIYCKQKQPHFLPYSTSQTGYYKEALIVELKYNVKDLKEAYKQAQKYLLYELDLYKQSDICYLGFTCQKKQQNDQIHNCWIQSDPKRKLSDYYFFFKNIDQVVDYQTAMSRAYQVKNDKKQGKKDQNSNKMVIEYDI